MNRLWFSIGLWKLVIISVLLNWVMGVNWLICGIVLVCVNVLCSLIRVFGLNVEYISSLLGLSMWWNLVNIVGRLFIYCRYRLL